MQDIDTKFSTGTLEVLMEGRVSQIFYLGLSSYFMIKNG